MHNPSHPRAWKVIRALELLFSAVPMAKIDVVTTHGAYVDITIQNAFALLRKARQRLATDGEPNATLTHEIDAFLRGDE